MGVGAISLHAHALTGQHVEPEAHVADTSSKDLSEELERIASAEQIQSNTCMLWARKILKQHLV